MSTLQELRARAHLSVHALKTFIDCPRKWFLRYEDRAEPAFRSVALALGTAIHEGVGYALLEHAAGRLAPRDEIQDVLKDALIAELHADGPPVLLEDEETEEDLIRQARGMLDALLDDLPMPEEVIGVEVPFSLELFDPDTGEKLDRPLIGAIDFITRESRQVTYSECKTSKRRWSADQCDYDMQLTAYGVALRELGHEKPKPRLVVVTKAKVPVVQIESPYRGPQHERDLAAIASGVLKAAKAGADFPIRGWGCRACPYAGACR